MVGQKETSIPKRSKPVAIQTPKAPDSLTARIAAEWEADAYEEVDDDDEDEDDNEGDDTGVKLCPCLDLIMGYEGGDDADPCKCPAYKVAEDDEEIDANFGTGGPSYELM